MSKLDLFVAPDQRWAASAPAVVEASATPDDQLVSLLKPRSFEAEQYRTLCQILESRRNSDALQVLGVTSAAIGDGKTTTSLNLAGSLAQTRKSRVLLIDGDMRCPAIASQLRLSGPARPGLAGAIAGPKVTLSSALLHLKDWNLSVLLGGKTEESPYELLKSSGFDRVIQEARAQFDFIIIDCPPLLAVPDCRLIARAVDGFLMVVSAHTTPRKLLAESLNVLPPSKLVGLILNRDNRPLSGYYGYYGRYYGPRDNQ